MKNLSIFIDESGDFGKYSQHSPFYIVSMVFHEQKNSIDEQVEKLNQYLKQENLENHAIHTAPLIRREGEYKMMDVNIRRKIFQKLFGFTRNVNIKYATLVIDKSQYSKQHEIAKQLLKQLMFLINENMDYFCSFDNIILYYDNGQYQLSVIFDLIFSTLLGDSFEFRQVSPNEYKLFQTADLCCTLALLQNKIFSGKIWTKSEKIFFGSPGKLKKRYLKYMDKIKF